MDVFKVIEFHLEYIYYPEFLLIQLKKLKGDNAEPHNITITRYAINLVIRVHDTFGEIVEEHEFLQTKKAIKELKYILNKYGEEIDAIIRMFSGNLKIFMVDVFQNHELAYCFQSSYEGSKELIVRFSIVEKKEINYDELLHDFKTIVEILNNEKAIYKIIDNPFSLVRRIKLNKLKANSIF